MGLFSKAKEMQAQAQEAMAPSQGAQQERAGMGADMEGQVAYAQLMQKLATSGVEAPGVIHTIRPTGQTDMGGGQMTEFDVSIKPASGEPYPATISQSMLPAQMEGLSEGQAITVKYDPDAPVMAIIHSW